MAESYSDIGDLANTKLRKLDRVMMKGRYNALLLRKGWKQADLAREVSCDEALISRIVNGREEPSPTMLIKIAKSLDVDSSVLTYNNFDIE